MTDGHRRWSGSRFVTGLYVALVALSGIFGYVIGAIRPEDLDPELFFIIQLPPTPLGLAIYGMVTVGLSLGILLVLVRVVGRRYDTERPDGP